MTGELSDARVIGDRLFLSTEDSARCFFSYKIFINFISITLNPINESTILFTLGFSIYFWLKLSNAHGYVLFVFINSDLVICYK